MLNNETQKQNQLNRTISFGIIATALILIAPDVMAAGGTESSLKAIAKIIQTGGNVIFIILMIVGLIRTVSGFVSNSPNAAKNLLMLVLGAAVWYGFNTIIDDIASAAGSSSMEGGFTKGQ